MRILALESATSHPSVALVEDGHVVAEKTAEERAHGSEALLPAIDGILRGAGVDLAVLDGFAIAIGPGSFTGLRVGLATLKGLAFGDGRPVAAISTLAALAHGAGEPRPEPVLAALDARRGEVYAALWDAGSEPQPSLPEGLYRLADLAGKIPERCLWVGDDVDGWPAAGGEGLRRGAPGVPGACASAVGILGHRALVAGEGQAAAALVPRYPRRAEAEAQRLGEATEAV